MESYLKSCEDFARVMILMGEYMISGHSYEEVYQYGLENSVDQHVRQIWQETLAIANGRRRSPLDALDGREASVAPWLTKVFMAGAVSGVETLWIRGGQAFLAAAETLRRPSSLGPDRRKRLIEDLTKAGADVGLSDEFSASAARQFIDRVAPE